MVQKFLSPGVTTTEIDETFIASGAPGLGTILIGRTPKGPAFQPVTTLGGDTHRQVFGERNPDYMLPYAAQNILKNADLTTTVRILGHKDGTAASAGYTVGGITAIVDVSGANSVTGSVLAVVHHSGTTSVVTVTGVALDANNFVFKLTAGATTTFAVTASFQTSSANYIGKVLNTDPTKYSTYGHYLYQAFPYQKQAASASWGKVGIVSASLVAFNRDFEPGYTPWIISQQLGGTTYELMRFRSYGDGRATNDDVKVQVANIKPSPAPSTTPWGSFDVIVRKFGDTDQRPIVLESFVGCTLNPADRNYVLRRIGDMRETFDTTQRKFVAVGTYPGKSKYIRVEINKNASWPDEAVPWGFSGYTKMLYSASDFSSPSLIRDLPYTPNQIDANGNYNSSISWGVSFVSGGVVDRMRAHPDSFQALSSSDTTFSLRHISGTYASDGNLRYSYNTSYTAYSPIYASASLQKFTMPLQGGLDGWDIRTEDPLYLTNSDTTSLGVVALKRAIDSVASPDFVDYNVIAIPGIHNKSVTDYCRTMVNERKDAFFVMDVTGSSVADAVDGIKGRELDDNYTACYYPDLMMDDTTNNVMVRVPPSVAVVGVLAYSDRVSHPWFAPAGLGRGALKQFDIVDVVDRLDFQDRNDLYDNRINPIASFPGEGVSIQGQKTLQIKSSALDRVNVRRLLIYAKKTVQTFARGLVFEPNNAATWQRFVNGVNPILDMIRREQGLERFKIVMDSTTTTQDEIDRNVMAGKIILVPTRVAEFIDVGFTISNAGVTFSA